MNMLGTVGIHVSDCVQSIFMTFICPHSGIWEKLCASMGSVSLNMPKYTVMFLATFGTRPFHFCSLGITTVGNGICAVSGVVQVLSHPGELLILPNMFSWVSIVKQTFLESYLERRCCCQDAVLKLQNFKRSLFLVVPCRDF